MIIKHTAILHGIVIKYKCARLYTSTLSPVALESCFEDGLAVQQADPLAFFLGGVLVFLAGLP